MDWYGFKEWVEMSTGLHMDALHVHAGVLCLILAALVLRRPLRSPLPWLVVLAIVLANEAYDLSYDPWPARADIWPNRDTQFAESLKDAWNTMLVPTVLLILCRFAPQILVGRDPPSHRRR